MTYIYGSPVGPLQIKIQDGAITGLDFLDDGLTHDDDALAAASANGSCIGSIEDDPSGDREALEKVCAWLDSYFVGQAPDPCELTLDYKKSPAYTPFREVVWELLRQIPYGETVSYQKLAECTAKRLGKSNMSAQAIGGAVGHNPIVIIIPCHRVIGKDGTLVGFAGGVEIKRKLLELESQHLT